MQHFLVEELPRLDVNIMHREMTTITTDELRSRVFGDRKLSLCFELAKKNKMKANKIIKNFLETPIKSGCVRFSQAVWMHFTDELFRVAIECKNNELVEIMANGEFPKSSSIISKVYKLQSSSASSRAD